MRLRIWVVDTSFLSFNVQNCKERISLLLWRPLEIRVIFVFFKVLSEVRPAGNALDVRIICFRCMCVSRYASLNFLDQHRTLQVAESGIRRQLVSCTVVDEVSLFVAHLHKRRKARYSSPVDLNFVDRAIILLDTCSWACKGKKLASLIHFAWIVLIKCSFPRCQWVWIENRYLSPFVKQLLIMTTLYFHLPRLRVETYPWTGLVWHSMGWRRAVPFGQGH